MAAYAALTSVLGTIEQLLRSNKLGGLQDVHKQQLKSLYDTFGTLQESLIGNGEPIITKDLQARIKDVALDAEDEVESLVKQLIKQDDEQVFQCCHAKFDQVSQLAIQVTDSVKEELIIKQKIKNCPEAKNRASPRLDASILENDMKGYEEERKNMARQLSSRSGSDRREVVSVVGMPGIGKTTFAKTMLLHNSIKNAFIICGWITVSKDYDLRKLLLVLLHDAIGMKDETFNTMDIGELAGRLQKALKGERYLIVVDDIWNKEDWDRITEWFPDSSNKSRILLTTRDKKVAEYAASSRNDCLNMRPLTPGESRDLFYHKAFGKNYNLGSDHQFEKVGEEVVRNCKGLPLMIAAVAGILSSKNKLDEWITVAQNVSSLVNDDAYKQCLKVLALSYNDLPSLMKACFLHFGVFPKASKISVKMLIRLWIAEGLLNLKGVDEDEFEQVAARLLHDLIGKSVVIVEKRSLNGQIKTCRIHDLFHDLCLMEAEIENLLYVPSGDTILRDCRWVSIQSNFYPSCIQYSRVKARSLYLQYHCIFQRNFLFKQLRVLDLGECYTKSLYCIIEDLVCLRYLAMTTADRCVDLPIINLWNLQTLIFVRKRHYLEHEVTTLPKEIWQMSQLRHLYATGISLCSPTSNNNVLGNLQSVSGLSPCCCTKEIFEGIKRVKKLAIRGKPAEYPTDPKWIDNLKYLQELESLSIVTQDVLFIFGEGEYLSLTSPDSFPLKLKKLKLGHTCLPWNYMAVISKLPNLEVLQLKERAFVGHEWKATEQMVFHKLKVLLLANLGLHNWRTMTRSDDHFPSLERVIIRGCKFLKEIPQEFADSKELELIELHKCTPSLVAFAKKIEEKHESFGRSKLKVIAFNTERSLFEPFLDLIWKDC